MKKVLGIAGLLLAIIIFAMIMSTNFMTFDNWENLFRRTALVGIMGVGAAYVIMGRGIDLSIGSVVCLVGLTSAKLTTMGWPAPAAIGLMLVVAAAIGLLHGVLITRLRLQPFVVTLCGLLIYRGLTRGVTADQTQSFHDPSNLFEFLTKGKIPIPFIDFHLSIVVVYFAVIAIAASVVLQRTVYGRYLLAIGRNEQAARYSGVNTSMVTIGSYMICSTLAGLAGVLYVMDAGSDQPATFGNFYELFAIAAAVLGGCSLRGGEGTIIGVVLGAAVLQTLRNVNTLTDWLPDSMEFAMIGAVILGGVVVDETVKEIVARRRTRKARNQT